MKSGVKKIILCGLVLLVAAGLFFAIRLLTLPRLDPGYTYNGHEYGFLSDKYGTSPNHLEAKKDKAVARFYDAVIYTLKDDPDEFYLSPRVFLAHLPYNVLVRLDMIGLPTEENVDHIEIGIPREGDTEWIAPDRSVQNALLEAYAGSTVDAKKYGSTNLLAAKEKWQAEPGCEVFDVRFWFKKPDDLFYKLVVVKRGEEYFLLLEDGSTLIGLEGDLLRQ